MYYYVSCWVTETQDLTRNKQQWQRKTFSFSQEETSRRTRLTQLLMAGRVKVICA